MSAAETAFDAMMLDGVPDEWKPVPLPVEDDAEEGVHDAPYAPVSALSVVEDHSSTVAAHLALLDPWTRMTPGEKDDHIQTCDGCDEICGDHRAEAYCGAYGRQVVILDNDYCPECGLDHLSEHDRSDVKASER